MRDIEGKEYVKNLYIYEVNMDRYKEICYNDPRYRYLIMLNEDLEGLKKLSKKNKVVKEYMEELVKLNENPEFRHYMTIEQDQKFIHNTELELAHDKGLSQGLLQGKIETAKKLIKQKVDINIIMNATGLSKEELDKLI